jgi:hypothetical protein
VFTLGACSPLYLPQTYILPDTIIGLRCATISDHEHSMGLWRLLQLLEIQNVSFECGMTIFSLFDTSLDASPERMKLNGWKCELS